MATPAHQETRRFTRGLGKPGTAAELRQSVSEVVRTSVLVAACRHQVHADTMSTMSTMSTGLFPELLEGFL
ncbi:Dedicator of cytokinesis protein 9 [Takifugu flavidus]|uniref:Dedicator of cytokinesis protein 9 n=1 Tax=Takifugu flavidus TaxID=433684 RepID=A0A5C6PN57_9TELE|nr:Dedicator of cytokinesis protein 9 [Takifugu flavidus]